MPGEKNVDNLHCIKHFSETHKHQSLCYMVVSNVHANVNDNGREKDRSVMNQPVSSDRYSVALEAPVSAGQTPPSAQ